MTDLLEISELIRRGVAAETILKVFRPLVEDRKLSILSRLVKAQTLEDFYDVRADARMILAVMSRLENMVMDAEVASKTAGASFPRA